MYRKRIKGWLKHWDFILVDLICLQISYILAYKIRLGGWWPYQDASYSLLALVVTGLSLMEFAFFNTLSNVLHRGAWTEVRQTVKHVFLLLASASLFMFSMQSGDTYSRIFVYVAIGIYLILSILTRMAFKMAVRSSKPKRSIFVVGIKDTIIETLETLRSDGKMIGMEIGGVCSLDGMPDQSVKGPSISSMTDRELLHHLAQNWVDEVFLDLPGDYPELRDIKSKIISMGIAVHTPIKARTGSHLEQIVENIGGYTVLTTSVKSATSLELLLKRCLDIVGGLVGCFFTVLICIVIAPIMKKQGPGPLFFKQERIGLNGKRFKMYKIRSMVMNADDLKKDLMKMNRVSDGMMFKLDWDPRIIGNRELPDGTRKTGIGEFIRKTSLDEFPQFFNVLKGEMSLVGTRPPTVDEWEKYDLHHRARMATKPGITGMWQVSGRSDITDFEEVVRLDTEYIYNWSFGLDLKILAKTVKSVLKHDGAM